MKSSISSEYAADKSNSMVSMRAKLYDMHCMSNELPLLAWFEKMDKLQILSSVQSLEDNSIVDASCSNLLDGSGAGLPTDAPKSFKDAAKKKKTETSSATG